MFLRRSSRYPNTDARRRPITSQSIAVATDPTGIVEIDEGLVVPVADGEVEITAQAAGLTAAVTLKVIDTGHEAAVNFPDRIVPIFTKLGCNSGGCHGKAAGQNGFRLSLLGFEPAEDYEHLIRESRGRRVSPASPEHSLLLRKATGAAPHGGGQRLKRESYEYRMLRRWITQGMPFADGEQPKLTSIEVLPRHRRLAPGFHR